MDVLALRQLRWPQKLNKYLHFVARALLSLGTLVKHLQQGAHFTARVAIQKAFEAPTSKPQQQTLTQYVISCIVLISFRSIAQMFISPSVAKILESKLVEWLIKDCRPVNLRDGQGFREFCATIGFTPPTRKTIAKRIDLTNSEHVVTFVRSPPSVSYRHSQAELKGYMSRASALSLTSDAWSSDCKDSFIGEPLSVVHSFDRVV